MTLLSAEVGRAQLFTPVYMFHASCEFWVSLELHLKSILPPVFFFSAKTMKRLCPLAILSVFFGFPPNVVTELFRSYFLHEKNKVVGKRRTELLQVLSIKLRLIESHVLNQLE